MNLTVAYIALATGVVVWFLIVRKLTVKSWETPSAPVAEDEAGVQRMSAKRVGLWVFLAVVTSLFALFVSAYYMRMGGHGHAGNLAVHDWVALKDPNILWLNTLILVGGSVAMQAARSAVSRGQRERAWNALLLGGLATLVFLAGQLYAWNEIRASDAFTPRNPAIAFFYVLTAVHGLHLLGGLYVWGRTLFRMRRPEVELIDAGLSIELCSVYWHYLLLVWLGLFVVLLST
ncbi:MAG TPA: cytochrome c oxidase subunit 3 [Steroidobacter sp.]